MIDALARPGVDQPPRPAGADRVVPDEAALNALSAQARRECAILGRLLARHALTPADRATLDAEIAATSQALADLNARLSTLRSHQQAARPAPVPSAA